MIKELNISLVLNLVREHGPISRVDIAKRTGLGRSTVSGIIGTLLREGLVEEIGSAESPSGRKPILVAMSAAARYAIGIKLAPRAATAALVDLSARVLHTEEVSLTPGEGPDAVVERLKQLFDTVVRTSGVNPQRLLGVGLVMPGVIDPNTGTATASYFLGWDNIPVRDILEDALNLPVFVDNDANAMVLAEALYGAGRGASELLGLTVGIGIGAGILIGGKIYRGARFSAGELGHVCVDPDGPRCQCGRQGCLEALAGDAAIIRTAREEMAAGRSPILHLLTRGHSELVTRDLVVEAAKGGDPGARFALAESGRWLGVAVGNVVNMLSPARVIVGGEAVLQAGDLILEPMREQMRLTVFPSFPEPLQVTAAALGYNAWVLGAAALVLQDAFEAPTEHSRTRGRLSHIDQP